ncbi:MAG: molybdopterin molybdotransferase MoeA [Sinobacterium sp.]|nr:molybdopterin molybdotransferase MoeA [Sinobacterium sp.]
MQAFDEALERLLAAATCIAKVEIIEVSAAFNRVLAEDIFAPISVPPFNNSAMDGIAFKCDATNLSAPIALTQTVFAGYEPKPLALGEACRIFTGAAMPDEADTVVLQENCCFESEGFVRIVEGSVTAGQHVRSKGEDLNLGGLVLSKGSRLSSAHIGLLASLGVAQLKAYKVLKVAVVSTGDELRLAGDTLRPGQIYNSNGPMLCAALNGLGFDALAFHVKDDLDATVEIFEQAAKESDVVFSIGGVSVGDADFVKQAIERQGAIDFWRVAMKPGKPLAFGSVGGRPLLGLPGNPVSAFSSFQLFAVPFLAACQGALLESVEQQFLPIELVAGMAPKRETFLRVSRVTIQGKLWLKPYASQGSGILSSVAFSEGFARIPQGVETESGDLVTFIPFH